jgi:hypothetical protein
LTCVTAARPSLDRLELLIAGVLEQSRAGPQDDRDDVQVELVVLAGGSSGLLERGLDSARSQTTAGGDVDHRCR